MRLGDILNFPLLRFGILFLFALGAFWGMASCFFLNKKLTFSLLFFIAAIFFHAWCHFFQPSLRSGISVQDFLLQNGFSAYFLIAQTRLYLMYFVLFLFPAISFCHHALLSEQKSWYRGVFLGILFFTGGLNAAVAIVQAHHDIHFLSAGSYDSVATLHACGLLMDYGEAGVFFSSFFSFLIFYGFEKKQSVARVFLLLLFAVLVFFGGFSTQSRNFYAAAILSCILCGVIFWVRKLPKFFLATASLFGFVSLLTMSFVSRHNYVKIDSVRYNHLRAMWAAAKENFWTGTGIGSFQENLFYYAQKLFPTVPVYSDISTNVYFQLLSELGVVGLLLIALLGVVFAKRLLKSRSQTAAGIAMAISFFVGSQAVNAGVAFLTAFVLALCLAYEKGSFFRKTLNVSSFYLLGVCLFLFCTSPVVPLFRWNQTGRTQVPLSVGTLPQPEGRQEGQNHVYFSELVKKYFGKNQVSAPAGISDGLWMKFGTEILLFRQNTSIYIPNEGQPFRVLFSFVDQQGRIVRSWEQKINKSGVAFVECS